MEEQATRGAQRPGRWRGGARDEEDEKKGEKSGGVSFVILHNPCFASWIGEETRVWGIIVSFLYAQDK